MHPPLPAYAAAKDHFLLAYRGDDPAAAEAVRVAAAALSRSLGVAVTPCLPDRLALAGDIPASAFGRARAAHAVVRVVPADGWKKTIALLLREVDGRG